MEIKFSNFANMGAVNIEFTDKINLLAGDNGSGKTLLLEAYSKANDVLLE
ncbi:TPA: AAA family ATPase, partial [Streptococcus suis]|nr:AAA family ATPase [Streptococcus suis]